MKVFVRWFSATVLLAAFIHHQHNLVVYKLEESVWAFAVKHYLSMPFPPGLCVAGRGYEQSCMQVMNGSHSVIAGCVELVRRPMEERGRDCNYFTVMRHPIDRLVSAFFYCPEHDPQGRPLKW